MLDTSVGLINTAFSRFVSCFISGSICILSMKGDREVDQKKIGSFLKELRKEKNLTQEQLAEKLNVSGRTVSRWETGTNMPDISLLAEIAELYEVGISEIISGERKSGTMNNEVKEVAQGLSEYAVSEKEGIVKEIRSLSLIGFVSLIIYLFLDVFRIGKNNEWIQSLSVFCQTLVYVVVLMIPMQTTGILNRFKKDRKGEPLPKTVLFAVSIAAGIAVAVLIKFLF